MEEILQNIWNSPSKYVLILIAVVLVFYLPALFVYMRKKKQETADFMESHPEAAEVFIKGVTQGTLTVMSVDDEVPKNFYRKGKNGFFLLPGENVLELHYSWQRPGIMYRTITTTIGPTKIKVYAEAYKKYNISYKKKEKEFVFEELTK